MDANSVPKMQLVEVVLHGCHTQGIFDAPMWWGLAEGLFSCGIELDSHFTHHEDIWISTRHEIWTTSKAMICVTKLLECS